MSKQVGATHFDEKMRNNKEIRVNNLIRCKDAKLKIS